MSKRNLGIKVIMVALLGLMVGCSGSESSDDMTMAAALLAQESAKSEASALDIETAGAAADAVNSGDAESFIGFVVARDITASNVEMAREILSTVVPEGPARDMALELLDFVANTIGASTDNVEAIMSGVLPDLEGILVGESGAERPQIDSKGIFTAADIAAYAEGIKGEVELPAELEGLVELLSGIDSEGKVDFESLVKDLALLQEILTATNEITDAQLKLAADILYGFIDEESEAGALVALILAAADKGLEIQYIKVMPLAQAFMECLEIAKTGDVQALADKLNDISEEIQGVQLELAALVLHVLVPDDSDAEKILDEFLAFVGKTITDTHQLARDIINSLPGVEPK